MDIKKAFKSSMIVFAFIGFYFSLLMGGPLLISVTAMIVKWLGSGI